MKDVDERLVKCFCTVFPQLSQEAAREASPNTVAEWDSVGLVTLLSVIQEEFGVELPMDDLEQFLSFASVHDYLNSLP
jgi:acyl carrier protein